MALPNRFLEELKSRVSLATVIGRRVRLIRNGRNLKACCPFHNEKTASFYIYDDHYHCFGCGAHGDAISFEMAAGGLSFMEAIEALAAEAGLEVPQPDPREREREARAHSLEEVMEAACAFFQQRLRLPEGRDGLAYLESQRGLSEATIAHFRLGYAPPGGALRAHLRREGLDDTTLAEAGLIGRPEDTSRAPYDMFRDRVIFPIRDRKGRVVSFGGRVLGDGKPKYLNGPESPLFSKSRLLYGLFEARDAIRETGEAIVAEGYMDVIALAAAGFAQTVAPLGTALTESQIELLWSLAPEPVLCFDGDEAGQRAAHRALDRALPLLTPGRSLRFALLPPGQDPDDLLRGRGPGAMRAALDAALPMAELCWRVLRARNRVDTPERRAALERDIERTVEGIADRSVAQQYRAALRDRFWTEVRGARGGGRSGSGGRRPGGKDRATVAVPFAAVPTGALPARRLQEGLMLAVLLNHPELFDQVAERMGMLAFSDPGLSNLRADLLVACDARLQGGEPLDRDDILDHLRNAGHGAMLDHVLGPSVSLHAAFARPSATPESALRGWEDAVAQHCRTAILDDCRAAEEHLALEMTEEALDRLKALQAVRSRIFDLPEGDGI
ncbi:DNA primase [Roseospira marina]|uniref:DNA primase n=1 Tax=Roseospira marina TaxID=140057 RepID=A0A5M6IGV8_9PROT|nr:DNA primase [Roseospira marina]KAA5607540.1 DNA primase [Roseospira marina]MBB4312275.1 DNA primase [Roseospira marina]MBB5085709.1 DNA primase [Roseospira marina]